MALEITTMTEYIQLDCYPSLPFASFIPCAIFPHGNTIERVLSNEFILDLINNTIKAPSWLTDSTIKHPRMLIQLNTKSIACVYYHQTKLLVCFGISHAQHQAFIDLLPLVCNALNTTTQKSYKSFKACGFINVNKLFNCNLFADFITNNNYMSNVIAICETTTELCKKHNIVLVIKCTDFMLKKISLHEYTELPSDILNVLLPTINNAHSFTIRVSMTFKYVFPPQIQLKLSRLPSIDTANIIYKLITILLQVYDKFEMTKISQYYPSFLSGMIYPENSDTSTITETHSLENYINNSQVHSELDYIQGIANLRQEIPRLFIKNYTRECAVLPIIISDSVISLWTLQRPPHSIKYFYRDIEDRPYLKNRLVIKYPYPEVEDSRYYTSSVDNMFVGLKVNRLKNSIDFPYLVTCYKSDHMLRQTSVTYKYYHDNNKQQSESKQYSVGLPRFVSLLDKGYVIKHIHMTNTCKTSDAFINALEIITNKTIDRNMLPYIPQLVKQEAWQQTDEDIMNTIRCGTVIGSIYFRYFEEYIKISIHINRIEKGERQVIPAHIEPYIWDVPYEKHIVLFEYVTHLYGRTELEYRVLERTMDNARIFSTTDIVIRKILAEKRRLSQRTLHYDHVTHQILDDTGKCRILRKENGTNISTFTRPMNLPLMLRQQCFLESHIEYMNKIKQQIDMPIMKYSKTSSTTHKYFPNHNSFQVWYENIMKF